MAWVYRAPDGHALLGLHHDPRTRTTPHLPPASAVPTKVLYLTPHAAFLNLSSRTQERDSPSESCSGAKDPQPARTACGPQCNFFEAVLEKIYNRVKNAISPNLVKPPNHPNSP